MWLAIKAFLIWMVARILLASLRVRVLYGERLDEVRRSGKPVIYAFWHGRQMTLFRARPEKRVTVMTSLSKDGELQSRICRWFGMDVVRGSSSKGGLRALVGLGRALKGGQSVGLAVDGPRGPAGRLKAGVLALASQSACTVLPVSVGLSRKRVLSRAWDGFQIPKLFSRAVVGYGEGLCVPGGASSEDIEVLRARLEADLHRLDGEVDAAAAAK